MRLTDAGRNLHLGAPPLYGSLTLRLSAFCVPAVLLAVGSVALVPALASGIPWRWLLATSAVLAGTWALSLSSIDGAHGITASLDDRSDYRASFPLRGSPRTFLAHFASNLPRYSIHARGHPPGMLLLLWLLRGLGAGGAGWEAGLLLVAFAACTPAVLVACRDLAGEDRARATAPFLAFAPVAALSVATTADALYAALGCWAAALVVLATRRRRNGDALAFGGGLLLGLALMGSYGLVLLAVVPGVVMLARRTVRPAVLSGAGIVAVLAGFRVFGFSWLDGLLASGRHVMHGVSTDRPGGYFLFANGAAFAVALGPAAATGLVRLRDRALWLPVGGAGLAVALADVSQLSRGEVERIWLPFVPWILLACSVLGRGRTVRRGWFAANVAAGLVLALTVRTMW